MKTTITKKQQPFTRRLRRKPLAPTRAQVISVRNQSLAVQMIEDGKTYDDVVAAVPGIKTTTDAENIVRECLQRQRGTNRKVMHSIQNRRLDFLWRELSKAIADGAVRLSTQAVMVIDRVCRLNGLDAPQKQVVENTSAITFDLSKCSDDDLKRLNAVAAADAASVAQNRNEGEDS